MTTTFRPRFWSAGDWNALFGFGTNILVNLLVLTGLLRFALQMPDELVFGRILPAAGLMLALSSGYYAWLAWQLSARERRHDVCALPSGVGVAHMFIVVFVIMLPIQAATGDAIAAWEAGLAWVFIQSVILMLGGTIAPLIRRITPRAALLGTLAGVSVTFIAMRPALEIFMQPGIGLICLFVILLGWLGKVRWPWGLPAGLVAVAIGTSIAWTSNLLGFETGGLTLAGIADSFKDFGFNLPLPAIGHTFSGFQFLSVLLVTAIPFGIYDLVEAMDNVESAAAAGDAYATQRVVVADGAVSMIGCLAGNPFINAVYIGHPGWKSMGGGIGYCAVTGIAVLLLAGFGLLSLLLALVPVVALLPILLYIGMQIGAQAFQESPARHAPAIVLAMVPHLAAWARSLVDGALSVAGTAAQRLDAAELAAAGVLYEGLRALGDGAILSGLLLGAMATFIIERQFKAAAGFAAAGGALSFFGFMHGEAVGWAVSPAVAAAYGILGLMLVTLRPVEGDARTDAGRGAQRRTHGSQARRGGLQARAGAQGTARADPRTGGAGRGADSAGQRRGGAWPPVDGRPHGAAAVRSAAARPHPGLGAGIHASRCGHRRPKR